MGLFSWMVGKNRWKPIELVPGDWSYEIVGESHYQDELSKLCGGKTESGVELECEADLIPERNNRHDNNAVMVEIDGLKVGYLFREDARVYKSMIGNQPSFCNAIIVGGWDRGSRGSGSFGVKLDIAWPPRRL
jgi:HIRAN domain